jgi:glycosyltransferase involved in cell wall biosynthesis
VTSRLRGLPTLSIVLPCLNEAGRLPGTLAAYLAHFPPGRSEVELIVVDDGSSDGTTAVADQIAAADPRVLVVRTTRNHGKGYAVRTGVQAAQGELVVFTDADGSYGPEQLEKVVAALETAPVAIGARLDPRAAGGSPLLRRLASPVFNRAMRLLLGLPYADTQCGLKGFRRDAAEALFSRARVDGFAFDAEALLVASRLGLEVVEVPVVAEDRQGSRVRLGGDAVAMLADVWKVRRAAAAGVYDEARENRVRDLAD